MRWFRAAAIVLVLLTQLLAIAMTAAIIAMCTHASHSHSIDGDPSYNGFLIYYILILIFQFVIITLAFFAYWIFFSSWRNNYQLDHTLRSRFVSFVALWVLFILGNMGFAIYCIVVGKEHQTEMATLYEKFAKYNQDAKFVAHLERYQREKECCGIYGPDDWLMVQLRSNMGGGGGGGGFQSLDYGFMQNPSTGKCHLLPPTVPMGCGKILLEEIHVQMNTYAGFMILGSVIGLIAAGFSAYCFYYWLEKEVIVIPEDEISNLIVLEPESSTDNAVEDMENLNSGFPYLGPPANFPPGGYPPSYVGSRPTRFSLGSSSSGSSGSHGPRPPKSGSKDKKSNAGVAPASSNKPPGDLSNDPPPTPAGVTSSLAPPPNNGNSGAPPLVAVKKSIARQPHSKNHLLHLQIKALGGKLLGEMHADHSKDSIALMGDAKGKKGREHHATVAIVRNRHPPKTKQLFASNPSAHHGQTGHLAEDIAAMSGNQNIIKNKLDDVVLPVEHGHVNTGPGGYLAQLELEKRRRVEESGPSSEVDGSAANVILQAILQPVAEAHAKGHSLADEERPHIKPHVVGVGSTDHHGHHGRYLNPHTGSHEHDRYLGAGSYLPAGSGGRYLPTGQHHHARYLNPASYASVRPHETNRYIDPGGYIQDHHEHGAHYLPDGAHHEHGAHYLSDGAHHEHGAHYLPDGAHHEHGAHLPDGAHHDHHHNDHHHHDHDHNHGSGK